MKYEDLVKKLKKMNANEKVLLAVDETVKLYTKLDEKNGNRVIEEIYELNTIDDIISYLADPNTLPIPFYVNPGHEPKANLLTDIINKEKIWISEKVSFPHISKNADGKGVLSNKTLTVLPLYVRPNQQIAVKEYKVAEDSMMRNVMGQASGASASGSLTDSELMVTIGQGADNVNRELLGPSSHDAVSKKEKKQSISRTGSVSLEDLTDDSENKRSLAYLSHTLRAYGVDTDLIETPLKW